MVIADIFVGSVSAAIGLSAIAIAAANWAPGFHFWIGHVIDARWGRTASRVVYAIAGIMLIALGLAIMLGFSPYARREANATLSVRCLDQLALMH